LVSTFEGTSADLLTLVQPPERLPKDWPASTRLLTQRLNRQAPVMRKAGWEIESDEGANKTHVTRWRITAPRPETGGISTSPPSPTSSTPLPASGASQAIQEWRQSQDSAEQVELSRTHLNGIPPDVLSPGLLAMFNGEDS